MKKNDQQPAERDNGDLENPSRDKERPQPDKKSSGLPEEDADGKVAEPNKDSYILEEKKETGDNSTMGIP